MSDSVPNYQSPGTEEIRSNPTMRKSHSAPASPGAGKPAGGTENLKADYKCIEGSFAKTPAGGSPPSTPQHFEDADV